MTTTDFFSHKYRIELYNVNRNKLQYCPDVGLATVQEINPSKLASKLNLKQTSPLIHVEFLARDSGEFYQTGIREVV